MCRLWCGHSEFVGVASSSRNNAATFAEESMSDIESAKEYLTRAASMAGPASTLLSRQILRSLALATGPHTCSSEPGYSATALVHSSVGSTQRQRVAQAYAKSSEEENSDASTLTQRLAMVFEAMDSPANDRETRNAVITSMYQEAIAIIPCQWRFVAMAVCPSGEVLLSSLCFRQCKESPVSEQTVCIFPGESQDGASSSVYQDILKPFDDIMERSRAQLNDMDSSSLDRYSENKKKRMWWEEREAIDEQLRALLESTEYKYFPSDAVSNLLYGNDERRESTGNYYVSSMCQGFDDMSSSSDDDEALECSLSNLADKFEAACAVMDDDNEGIGDEREEKEQATPPEKMTVSQIKDELEKLGVDKSSFKQLRKAALIKLLHGEREKQAQRVQIEADNDAAPGQQRLLSGSSQSLHKADGIESNCTFLILDEDLQRFPFEGFMSMKRRTICRIPSVAFAVATLLERKQRPVKANGARYVLDPEANLASTKRTMLSALDSLTSKFKWTWEGTVGELPSEGFVENALTNDDGFFLYCGHGGGEKSFSRGQVEKLLFKESDGTDTSTTLRRCSSTIVLMGCSSGKLISVNSSRSNPPLNLALEYEPEGMALSYLCAGSPCVVGNLWDVTDRDIDRYCIALLKDFLDPRGEMKSLPRCVADARSVCKMRHIVGCAPVVYGVPVVAENLGY